MNGRRDILAVAAGAVVARTVLPLAARAEASHPDAELIAACEAYPAKLAAYNADPDEWEGPLWEAMMASYHVIRDAVPQTLAGVIAKARAARFEADRDATLLNGEPEPEFTCSPGAWAWDVMNDLLRLAGEAS